MKGFSREIARVWRDRGRTAVSVALPEFTTKLARGQYGPAGTGSAQAHRRFRGTDGLMCAVGHAERHFPGHILSIRTLPRPHAFSLPSPAGFRQVRTEQPTIGSLVCKSADSRQAEVDGGRRIITLLEADSVSSNDGLVEGEARFRAISGDETADRAIVRSLRTRRGQTSQDCGFRLFEIRQLQDSSRIAFTVVLSHSSSLRRREVQSAASVPSRLMFLDSVLMPCGPSRRS